MQSSFSEFKRVREIVNRLVEKRQYYNNKVLRRISTKGSNFRDINEITGKLVESKQISLRSEGGATVDDGEFVADLVNKYFTTIACNELEQSA